MTRCRYCYKIIPPVKKKKSIMDIFGNFYCDKKCENKMKNSDWRASK